VPGGGRLLCRPSHPGFASALLLRGEASLTAVTRVGLTSRPAVTTSRFAISRSFPESHFVSASIVQQAHRNRGREARHRAKEPDYATTLVVEQGHSASPDILVEAAEASA
jgi:hypothetical protein